MAKKKTKSKTGKYAKMSLEDYAGLKEIKAARKLAEKNWGRVKDPVWKIVLRIAVEKKLSPKELTKLIKPSRHPAEVFVKKK